MSRPSSLRGRPDWRQKTPGRVVLAELDTVLEALRGYGLNLVVFSESVMGLRTAH